MNLFYYRKNENRPTNPLPPQMISYWELTMLSDGNMEYRANGKTLPLSDGEAIFLPFGTHRARDAVSGCSYVSFNFRFAEKEDTSWLLSCPSVLQWGDDPVLRNLLSAADASFTQTRDPGDECLGAILSAILIRLKKRQGEIDTDPIVIGVKTYVREHGSERILLSQIASYLSYSPEYIDGVFRRETGVPVIAYVRKERIRMAQVLLYDESLSLREISERCGFSEQNYFSRVFRTLTGCTPKQYRARFCQ